MYFCRSLCRDPCIVYSYPFHVCIFQNKHKHLHFWTPKTHTHTTSHEFRCKCCRRYVFISNFVFNNYRFDSRLNFLLRVHWISCGSLPIPTNRKQFVFVYSKFSHSNDTPRPTNHNLPSIYVFILGGDPPKHRNESHQHVGTLYCASCPAWIDILNNKEY